MAELADALDSGSSVSNDLEVQLLSSALNRAPGSDHASLPGAFLLPESGMSAGRVMTSAPTPKNAPGAPNSDFDRPTKRRCDCRANEVRRRSFPSTRPENSPATKGRRSTRSCRSCRELRVVAFPLPRNLDCRIIAAGVSQVDRRPATNSLSRSEPSP